MDKKEQQVKKEFGKRFSLDSSLREYMDTNKYIEHLVSQLEEQRWNVWREKLSVARLQQEVARSKSDRTMREKLIHELEEERYLRLESEKKLQEVTLESERNRVQMRGLQQQFLRMEETVRNLLQSRGSTEPHGEEPVAIIKAYQETLTQEGKRCKTGVEDISLAVDKDSRNENSNNEEGKEKTKLLLERLKALEAENSALAMENENQREQYERCLDEVANQVVQALLTQKDLREECLKLKTRVFDLEQQNRTLSVLFQQRMKPASGLLLQKLHLRILDLASGDFLSEVEKNRSLIQSRSADVQVHECLQNMKSGVPSLKCSSPLNVTGPHRVYPRSSCSSSELSLSSACSEYSSGSSYTWNDGKTCNKRSSINWENRIAIGSSLPSTLSSPSDELPPIRIKENHILQGLKKLQRQKILLEPASVLSKWGYKDCMDSNEGIYSPGIKCNSHKEQSHCTSEEIGSICIEHQKAFMYDSDSHEDADDESSSLALLYAVSSKDCRHCSNKLTHSVSDSLFGWEPDRRHWLGRGSYFNAKERPEKLSSFVDEFNSQAKSRTNVELPGLPIDKSLADGSWRDLNLHLSDTDDNEIVDELHIESSDEKSPSDLSLTPFVGKHVENSEGCIKKGYFQLVCSEKEADQGLPHSDLRPKAYNFVKQQKIIKTSSEECITVIFDAEDGKPIEFSSHQTGAVTLTRDEIAVSHPYVGLSAECAEHLPQGKAKLQKATDAKDYSILQTPHNETDQETVQYNPGCEHEISPTYRNDCPTYLERVRLQNTPQQKQVKPISNIPSKPIPASCMQSGSNPKHKWTKIPSRGKFSPQKTKVTIDDDPSSLFSCSPETMEKLPVSPVKCSRFKRVPSPTQNPILKIGARNPRALVHTPPNSKTVSRAGWHKNQPAESNALSQPLVESGDCGELPTRDVLCDLPALKARSLSPPPPPGRSASVLMRPSYEYSPHAPDKPGAGIPSESGKNEVQLSPLKRTSRTASHKNSMDERQSAKLPLTPKKELNHLNEKGDMFTQSKCTSEPPPGVRQGTPKLFTKKISPKPSNQSVSSCSNKELGHSKDALTAFMSHDINATQSGPSLEDAEVTHKETFPHCLTTSPDCPIAITGEPLLSRMSHSPLSLLSQGNDTGNTPDKGLKPHLPVGLRLFIKSPQLLRRSSTMPGKQEKDSMNAASRGGVDVNQESQDKTLSEAALAVGDRETKRAKTERKESFVKEFNMDPASSVSSETCSLVEQDGLENKLVKRSASSGCKTHLKPALGMNGAKARSQSFSVHTGEKSPIQSTEGLGKVRTQIITNTSERGNSLTRQNSTVEGLQIKAVPGVVPEPAPDTTKCPEASSSGKGSCASMSSSTSQIGSPNKLPLCISQSGDLFQGISETEGNRSSSLRDVQTRSVHDEKGSEMSRHQPVSKKSVTQAEMASQSSTSISSEQMLPLQKNPGSLQHLCKRGGSKTASPEGWLKASGGLSASSILQPTIEEKVMMCIQENMQKGQRQSKPPATETKPKSGGPSIASWFGFRRSKLPALSGRKTDISKVKVEKKEAKAPAFGSKQAKSEKRKDKKKAEQHCEVANELNKKTSNCGILDSAPKGKKTSRATPNRLTQNNGEQKDDSGTAYSGKDCFMKELLHRVDKKAAQQTESGSNNVSYRNVSKGSSQSLSLPSKSIGTQGNLKKSSKTKADTEKTKETVVEVVADNFPEDEEDVVTDSACQSHLIESCCQMRTLDSGIGTFPLPDSGNRSTGRHLSKQDLEVEMQEFTSPGQAFSQAPSEKAKTLEREVPSTTNKNRESVENMISHSASDPTMAAKGLRTFQSRLPKPVSAGVTSPVKKYRQEQKSVTSASLEYSKEGNDDSKIFPDWNSKKAIIKAKDRALRVCTYSASSSSDTETELEYETNDFGTRGEKLVDLMNNKQAEQEENSVRKSFMGKPVSILDLYQHSLCGHFGQDGSEQLAHYSFIEQLNGTSVKDGTTQIISSKLKPPEGAKEDSEKLSELSLESLNKFNSSRSILLEGKTVLEKAGWQEKENEKTEEEVSLSSLDRHGVVDHVESLSDSLYDSFSSCASQGSNDVYGQSTVMDTE